MESILGEARRQKESFEVCDQFNALIKMFY